MSLLEREEYAEQLKLQIRRGQAARDMLNNEAMQFELNDQVADAEADLASVPIEEVLSCQAAVMHWKSAKRLQMQIQAMADRMPDAQKELDEYHAELDRQ